MKKSSRKRSKPKVKKNSTRRTKSPKIFKKSPKYSMNILNIDHNKIYIHLKKNNRKSDGGIEDDVKKSEALVELSNNIKNNELFKSNSSSWSSILLNYDDKQEKHMKSIVKSRKDLIDGLLKLLCVEREGCSSVITGSETLKSDIDVTLLVTKDSENFTTYEHLEKILESVGDLFDGDKNSSELLDVNFYCHSYFFPKNFGELLTKNPKKEEFYLKLDEKYENPYKSQLGFALLKIAMYFKELELIVDEELNSIISVCKEGLKNFQEISKSPLLKKTDDPYEIYNYVVNDSQKDTNKSKKYIDQLEYINTYIKSVEKTSEFESYTLLCEISHASIYAEEAYFCYGAFMDVVYNNQLNQSIELDENCYIHSILDNFGFLLQVYTTNKENTNNFIIKGSKYIQRIYSAYNKITAEKDQEKDKEQISEEIRQNSKKDTLNPELINDFFAIFKSETNNNANGIVNKIYEDIMDNIIKTNATPRTSRTVSLESSPFIPIPESETVNERKIPPFPSLR